MCLGHTEAIFVDTQTRAWEGVPGVNGAHWKVFQVDPRTGGVQALVRFPAGAVEPPHHHTHGHWIYVEDGAKLVENLSRGTRYLLSGGMYLYTPAPDVHRVTYLSRCTFLFVSDGPFDLFWDGPEQGVIIPPDAAGQGA
ncbi:MAG: cupin domain-containing protein [Myxococcales bacterium]|nr:cupin domain-containing protein [Myxococcota bacterium]MDW8283907.1 cupin domain-containing protein [Myxococcales bacterium]